MINEPFETLDEFSVHYSYGYGGISRFFRDIVDEQRLTITRCPECGKGYCPPRADCPSCWVKTEWEPHDGHGTVISCVYCYWAPIDSPLRQYVELPYVYGLVQLDGTSTCLNALIHVDDLTLNKEIKVGDRVTVEFREKREGRISDFYFRRMDGAQQGDGDSVTANRSEAA